MKGLLLGFFGHHLKQVAYQLTVVKTSVFASFDQLAVLDEQNGAGAFRLNKKSLIPYGKGKNFAEHISCMEIFQDIASSLKIQ